MRSLLGGISVLFFAAAIFAQNDRGTITGTITDPGGAVIASAPVEVKNVDTGALYQAAASGTGNFTLAQLPAGNYELSVTVSGFKKYVRQNILLPVAQIVRVDVMLEVGAATESVTITAEAPLLKTESGELSQNVATDRLDSLPVLGIGSSASGASGTGLRNPYAVLNVIPGADWRPDASIRINGTPSNTMGLRIEGQEASTGLWYTQSWTQPSVDAIQEFAIETSNYSAEFGQAGGGVFNTTMKSGTNQYHGTAYDYFDNEALNAGVPFTNDGSGHLLRPRVRRNDYGFTFGGPVWLPRIYNGHDRTFFFFNFEQFRETQVINNQFRTVPTQKMHNGDLSEFLTSRTNLGLDPLGRPIPENGVYDPATERPEIGTNGTPSLERDLFPGNIIPLSRIDPVSSKILGFMPLPNRLGTINNYLPTFTNPRVSSIPSVKIDQSLGPKIKLSGYWSRTSLDTPARDGMPYPITSARGYNSVTHTVRINYDHTLQPTLLLHAGIGILYQNYQEVAGAQGFDPRSIGLKGANDNAVMPTIGGLSNGQGGYAVGTQAIGPFTLAQVRNPKPTANLSLTWVRGNHTYKAGGDLVVDGYLNFNRTYAEPWITFSRNQTDNPGNLGLPLAGTAGVSFASFLLGAVDNGYTSIATHTRIGKHSISAFVQDSWKITRKLTLDYGLRYDFQTYLKEHTGVMPNMSAVTPNPTAGGLPGGTIFEATCKCDFSHNYPYAFGPRLGVAYQVIPKTVVRAGIGVSYSRTAANNFQSYAVGANTPYAAPATNQPAYLLKDGLPYVVKFPNFDPGLLPYNGIPGSTLNYFDRNAGRPARMLQWSIGVQREFARDFLVEASYVGNRGVWWQANSLVNDNAVTPDYLAARGIDINNATDRTLLTDHMDNADVIARGYKVPYPSFPTSQTLLQALLPFPEYTSILRLWVPLGETWYNSLQVTGSKRLSHGFDFTSSFTWAKQETIGAESDASFFQSVTPAVNDVFNRKINKYLSGYDQPLLLVFSGNYTTPRIKGNKALSWAARDWQLGAVLRYGSGLPIRAPYATNALMSTLNRQTFANRVPGVSLFTTDLNCHCYDPNTTFVLNQAAWTSPAPGQFGTSAAYYSDYRYQRRPTENVAIGRVFRIKERASLNIRAEFTNIFNRARIPDPTAGTAPGQTFASLQQRNAAGQATAGFGWVNTNPATPVLFPRQGQLVARFTF
jgi:hypothetical protein